MDEDTAPHATPILLAPTGSESMEESTPADLPLIPSSGVAMSGIVPSDAESARTSPTTAVSLTTHTSPIAPKIEDSDEEDIVIRPRSRAKKSIISRGEEEAIAEGAKVEELKPEILVPAQIESQVPSNRPHSNEDDDEEGNTKVDEHGALIGDRSYTSKAFRLPTRGETYYFLATEIARVSGYRDSYLLFHKNRNLKKLMTTEDEKAFLIQQELIPYSYRNRHIGVVKALSIYKTFGSKVIAKGRRVKDDYFAQRARDQGFTEEDFANEEDRPVEDRMNAQAEANRRAETEAEIALASNAKSALDYNTMINQQRRQRAIASRELFRKGVPL